MERPNVTTSYTRNHHLWFSLDVEAPEKVPKEQIHSSRKKVLASRQLEGQKLRKYRESRNQEKSDVAAPVDDGDEMSVRPSAGRHQ